MGTGVDWEYVERNPVAGVKLPPGKPVKRAPVLPVEKLGELIARLPEPYRTMAVLGTTGMRESEILGLRWDDFDTEKLVIRVRRSQYRGQINPTKSEGSERDLPYGEIISDGLTGLRASGLGGNEYLFVTPKGTLFRSSDVGKKAFRTAAKDLGLPELTWRSFRRSVETLLHTEGVPMKIHQQILHGVGDGIRTRDVQIHSLALYHLSYTTATEGHASPGLHTFVASSGERCQLFGRSASRLRTYRIAANSHIRHLTDQ